MKLAYASRDQFERGDSSFDRLAETDVGGEKQAPPRRAKQVRHGHELVRFVPELGPRGRRDCRCRLERRTAGVIGGILVGAGYVAARKLDAEPTDHDDAGGEP